MRPKLKTLMTIFITSIVTIFLYDTNRNQECTHIPPGIQKSDEAPKSFITENSRFSEYLKTSVRVCTFVLTYPEHHDTRAAAVRDTWGKRMNKILFMSSLEDAKLPSVNLHLNESRSNLWAKTKLSFKYLHDYYMDDCDWFMKADDDTYVIVENLRYMLGVYSPDDPIFFGSRFKPFTKQGYMSGGGGYVLSKSALLLFVENGLKDKKICRQDGKGAEDVELGKCLDKLGVSAGDSRDEYGRGRFFPFAATHYLTPGHADPSWYKSYQYYPAENGSLGVSDTAISFHYVTSSQMFFLDKLLYDIRPVGVKYMTQFPMPLPPDLSSVPKKVVEKYGLSAIYESQQKELEKADNKKKEEVKNKPKKT